MADLPSGFEDLEPLVAKWSKATERERNHVRIESSIEELDEFYHAIFPRIEDVLGFLNRRDLYGLNRQEKNLLFLALSLAEVAPSVELFRSPEVPDGFDSRRFVRVHVAHQTPDVSPA